MIKGLYACIITYNDYPLIKKTVESVENQVEKIIAVDGKYNEFPGRFRFSTDGTREYLLAHQKVTLFECADVSQIEKRNKALHACESAKYVLFLDADEELIGEIQQPKADVVQVPHCAAHRVHSVIHRNRIIRNIPGLHFKDKHYWLKDKDGDTFSLLVRTGHKYTQEKQEQLLIKHYDKSRSKERIDLKKKYYSVLSAREGQIEENQ